MYFRRYAPLLVLLWIISLVFLFFDSRASVKRQLSDSIIKNELEINQLLDIAIAYNSTIKKQMDTNINFINNEAVSHPLLMQLKDFPELNAYGFRGDENVFGAPYEANLTGIGSLDSLDFDTLQEINAALLLNLATPTKEDKHEFIWSYYTSSKGFMLLSPSTTIDQFNFTESVYNKPFWQVATPKFNPKKQTVISDLYDDAAGKGWMISISTPVYSGSTFKGVISLDVGIKYLEKRLHSTLGDLKENLLLTSKNGFIITGEEYQRTKAFDLTKFDVEQLSPYHLMTVDDNIIYSSNLIQNKFYVFYQIPKQKFNKLVIKNALNEFLICTLTFIVLYLVGHLLIMLKKTRRLAQIDGLTQIYNRQTLEKLSIREFMNTKRRSGKISAIMIDIDHFKNLNDTHGHKVGDHGIQHVTKIVNDTIRKTDIFGRYGGEEFLLTLPNTDIQATMIVAEKLRLAVETSSFEQGIKITISLGCSEYCASNEDYDDGVAFQDLCNYADKALYQAKQQGRNCVKSTFFRKI